MIRSKCHRTIALFLLIGLAIGLACELPLRADDTLPASNSGSSSTLTDAIAELGSGRFAVRREATRRIIAFGVEAIEPVAEAARSTDREVQQRALSILQHFAAGGHVEAQEAILALVADSDPRVARSANNALEVVKQSAIAELKLAGAKCHLVNGKLDRLEASSGKLSDDDLQPLLLLPSVKEINLRDSPITNAGLSHLQNLTQLQTCNLQRTGVSDSGLAKLSHLTGMRSFSVENTEVTDLGLEHLKNLRQLTTLYIGGSKIQGPGLESLSDLPITYLSMQGSQVDDTVVKSVVHLKHLTTLGLDDVPVTDACLPTLLALKDLEVLWLDSSEVTDAAIDDLVQFKKLRKLHLRDTLVTKAGLERLRKELPDVSIYHSERKGKLPSP